MKKIFAVLIVLITVFLASCGSEVVDTTAPTGNTTETTAKESTTITAATATTEATIETTNEATTSPAIEIDVEEVKEHLEYMSSLPIIGDYKSTRDIPFESFYRFNGSSTDEAHRKHWYADNYRVDYDTEAFIKTGVAEILSEFYQKNPVSDMKNTRQFYIFSIAGCYGDQLQTGFKGYPMTDYYAYGYKCGEEDNSDQVYTLAGFHGIPKTLCWGYHRYDIGDKYLFMLASDDSIENYEYNSKYDSNLAFYLKIEEIDGVLWVYADNHWSLESMKCAVKITDEYENLMYKPGKDDDVIAYMEANGIDIPTYDFKCELGAFIAEMMSK